MRSLTPISEDVTGMRVCISFRRYSDEDLSKLGIGSPSSVALSPSSRHALSTPASRHLNSVNAHDTNAESADLDMTSVFECIKTSREVLQRQMDEVLELKVCTGLWLFALLTVI